MRGASHFAKVMLATKVTFLETFSFIWVHLDTFWSILHPLLGPFGVDFPSREGLFRDPVRDTFPGGTLGSFGGGF